MRSWVFSRQHLAWSRLRFGWPAALLFFREACWKVSSHGRIRDSAGRISQGSLHGTGYRRVTISGQNWTVHRIVKITFHGLPKFEQAWQVHHLDGNRSNNHLDNLKYVTASENVRHSFSKPSRRTSGPARSKPVLWRPVGSTSWTTSPSATVTAQQLGMCKETVSEACRTESAAKGYEFRYQNLSELVFPGEEWRPVVVDPLGGKVPGRMVSSLGRITSQAGLISRGHLTQQGYYATMLQTIWSGPVQPKTDLTFLQHPPLDVGLLQWLFGAGLMALMMSGPGITHDRCCK
ncbi:unnamed protein product [Durusdinium trenchii]|uniref:HNH nuclease domain-containing protein n=2 Tax=Durusdinium trenchii TaxID=1381693 RepID=A0ABP0MB81_9DINO